MLRRVPRVQHHKHRNPTSTSSGTTGATYEVVSVRITVTVAQIIAGPGGLNGFKVGFANAMAVKLSIPVTQIPTAYITFTETIFGRHAEPLHTTAGTPAASHTTANFHTTAASGASHSHGSTAGFRICSSSGVCTATTSAPTNASSDDDFPGWAIALCVILPLLAIGGAAAAYFLLSGDSSASGEISGTEPVATDTELSEKQIPDAQQIADAAAQPEGQV